MQWKLVTLYIHNHDPHIRYIEAWARNLIVKMGPGMFCINSPANKFLCHAILFYIELTFYATGKTNFLIKHAKLNDNSSSAFYP